MKKLQNGINFYFDFEAKFDLEGRVQSTHNTIEILTKEFCTYSPNLEILAGMGDKFCSGQTHD